MTTAPVSEPGRLVRWIVAAYPASYRRTFGRGMAYALERQAAEARARGRIAAVAFWLRTAGHCLAARATERQRSQGAVERLAQGGREIRLAARRLRRSPGFTATTVATLALGLGATTTIHAVVDGVLLEPLPYPEPERLVWIGHSAAGANIDRIGASYGTFLHYRDHAASLDGVAVYRAREVTVLDPEGPARIDSAIVSHQLFDLLFDGPPPLGRWIEAADDRPDAPEVAVISDRLWRDRYGGGLATIGHVETIDDRPVQIVGVLPAGFRFLSSDPDILLAARLDEASVPLGAFMNTMVGRMHPGTTAEHVRRDLTALLPSMRERFNPIAYDMLVRDGRLAPIVEPLKTALVGSIERTLWLLAATVALVLLIACANVANLFLVRAESRRREGWIRTALGAGRWPVVRAFVCESVLLTLGGAAIGLLLARIGTRLLVRHGPSGLPRLESVAVVPTVALTALGLALLAGVGFGLLAGVRLRPAELARGLDDGGRGTTAGARVRRLRHALVVAQVSLALVLLVGAALMLQSFWRLGAVDPGFEPEGAIGFRVALSPLDYPSRDEAGRFQQRLANTLAARPAVDAAGAVGCLPLDECGSRNVIYVDGAPMPEGELPEAVEVLAASGGAFAALGIPLLEGRELDDRDLDGVPAAILSDSLARRLFPDGDALGHRIHPDYPEDSITPYTVVGIVGDHYSETLQAGPTENLYLSLTGGYPYMADPHVLAFVVRGAGDPEALAATAREVLRELDPNVPMLDVRPLRALAEASRASTSFTLVLLLIAGAIALALGMVGVYGVLAYTVGRRTAEIGVRMALGARADDVRRMVTLEGLGLVGVGIGLGVVGALGLSRAISSILFGVEPTDPATYAAVALLLAVVASLASWLPAHRAARIDPADALRSD